MWPTITKPAELTPMTGRRPDDGPRYAAEARDVATQVFGRLADPVSTAADTCVVGDPVHIRLREPLWQDLALSSGYPGVSLAFMGRGTPGPVDAARGHAYLVRALHAVAATAHQPGASTSARAPSHSPSWWRTAPPATTRSLSDSSMTTSVA